MLTRFLVNKRISFRSADDPFLLQWIAVLRSTYDVPSAFRITQTLLPAEKERVEEHEKKKLKTRKRITLLIDGWEDCQRRSIYGTMAAQRGETPVLLELEDMTGRRADANNSMEVLEKGMRTMELDIEQTLALVTDNPTVMRKFRRDWEIKYPFVLVSIYRNLDFLGYELTVYNIFTDICMLLARI